MSIISNLTPFDYNPVNAPIWFVPYSEQYWRDGFKYYVNLYSYNRINSASFSFMGQYKVPPRPTGEGLFDMHKIVKSTINNNSSPNIDDITNGGEFRICPDDSVVKFRYGYGYGYENPYPFSSTSATVSGTNSFVRLDMDVYTLDPPLVGDILTIAMSPASSNTLYNGPCIVTGVRTTPFVPTGSIVNWVDTNIPFGFTESNIGGQITFRETIIGTSSFSIGVNGTRQYVTDLIKTPSSDWVNEIGYQDVYGRLKLVFADIEYNTINEGNYNFLTTYGLGQDGSSLDIYKETFIDDYECQSIISKTQSEYTISVVTKDINRNIIGTYSLGTYSTWDASNIGIMSATSSLNDYVLYTIGCGPKNIKNQIPTIFDGVTYYELIYSGTSSLGTCEAKLKRKIVKNCSPFKNYRFMFLNRLGGYDFYNFNFDSKLSTSIERKEFNKTLDYNYKIGDRGRSVLTIGSEDQVIVNSDWISEYDFNYLQELMTSPDVYIIVVDDDNEVKYKLPILITDTNWEQKTTLRDKVFNMTLTFKYAYNKNLQSY